MNRSFVYDTVTKKWYDNKENTEPAENNYINLAQVDVTEVEEDISELQRLLPDAPEEILEASPATIPEGPDRPRSPPPAIPIHGAGLFFGSEIYCCLGNYKELLLYYY